MRKQRGIVAIIMTVAMLALLAVTALAIDVNHMYMNRTKLQNGVDAAALAAAVILDNSGSQAIGMKKAQENATAAVIDTLNKLVGAEGNAELDITSDSVSVTYNSHSTFDVGACTTGGDCYVRVAVNNLDLQSFFMQLFTDTKQIAASAVAGPSAGAGMVCNVVPMTACAVDTTDKQHSGFVDGETYPIGSEKWTTDIGPGNFQLLDFSDESDDHLREQLAGGYTGCSSIGDKVWTNPGKKVGQADKGLNSRFEEQKGSSLKGDYVPDTNANENITHDDYILGEHNHRRMLIIPIVDCGNPIDEKQGGKKQLSVVSLGCFFMKNKYKKNANTQAEYVDDCPVNNSVNNGNSNANGPYRIVLYKDPFNEDS
ncbi:pilus assembly protein TadG-related protein [Vibrio sp. PNB22_3_1]